MIWELLGALLGFVALAWCCGIAGWLMDVVDWLHG